MDDEKKHTQTQLLLPPLSFTVSQPCHSHVQHFFHFIPGLISTNVSYWNNSSLFPYNHISQSKHPYTKMFKIHLHKAPFSCTTSQLQLRSFFLERPMILASNSVEYTEALRGLAEPFPRHQEASSSLACLPNSPWMYVSLSLTLRHQHHQKSLVSAYEKSFRTQDCILFLSTPSINSLHDSLNT